MAGPLPPIRFERQPQYPTGLNKNHPLGKLVTAAVAAHTNRCRTELVTGRIGVVCGTAPTVGVGAGGIGAVPSNTGSGWGFPATPAFCDASADFSIEFLITYNGGSIGAFDRLWEFGGAGAGGGGWDIEGDFGNGFNFVTFSGGSVTLTQPLLSSLVTGRTYHLVITRQGTTITGYKNGVVIFTQTGITVGAGIKTQTNYGSFQDAGSNSTTAVNTLFFLFYNGTVLNGSQVRDRFSNQWGIFQPARQFYFLPSVSGGGGGTQNITISQATLKFAGFSLGANAKSQLSVSQGAMRFAGFALGTNAKTQTAITTAPLTLGGFPLSVNAKSMFAMARGSLTFAGQVLGANVKSMLTMAQGALLWAGRTITVTGVQSLAISQAVIRFGAQSLINSTVVQRMLALLGVGQ